MTCAEVGGRAPHEAESVYPGARRGYTRREGMVHERARATPIALAACALLAPAAALRSAPAPVTAAPRDGVMTYIHHPPESARDVRYLYQWEVLRTALEKTHAKWGPYRLVAGEVMTERRQAYELRNATGN